MAEEVQNDGILKRASPECSATLGDTAVDKKGPKYGGLKRSKHDSKGRDEHKKKDKKSSKNKEDKKKDEDTEEAQDTHFKRRPREENKHYLLKAGADVEEHNLYVKGFDVSVKESTLKEALEERGVYSIIDVRIPRHFDRTPKPFAYITLKSPEDIPSALKLTEGLSINKRKLFIARSKPTKDLYETHVLFVDGLDVEKDVTEVHEFLTRNVDSIPFLKGYTVKVIRATGQKDNPSKSSGHAYIEFEEQVDVLVEEAKTLDIEGIPLKFSRSVPLKDHRWQVAAKPKLPRKELDTPAPPEDTLYINNLSFKVKEEDLEDFLEEHVGGVDEVKIVLDDRKRSKGFGYARLENAADVPKALAISGSDLKGRNINIFKSDRHITTQIIRPAFDIKSQKKEAFKKLKEDKEVSEESEGSGGYEDGGFGGLASLLGSLNKPPKEKQIKQKEEDDKKIYKDIQVTKLKKVEGGRLRLDSEMPLNTEASTPKSNADFRKMFLGI